jgi:hypothetical protein
MSLAQAGQLDEAVAAAAAIADDPDRKLAVMTLVRKLLDAGRDAEAREMAERDPLLGADWVNMVIDRIRRSASTVPIEMPATLALEGRLAEALRLAGDPTARWINLVNSDDRGKAKSRLPQLLTIYFLAQAAHAE